MASIPFRKMHGLGNDFVVVDARQSAMTLSETTLQGVADRHRGVGFDQFITIEPPRHPSATIFMGIRNPDGSESGACGNATRCVAALMMDELGQASVLIETLAGLLPAHRGSNGDITVDMGEPRLDWAEIPLAAAHDTLSLPIHAGPLSNPVAVNMGNPHAVFFVERADFLNLHTLGPIIEHDPLFPQRTNVEMAEILNRRHIRLRVWERGAGVTLACGSGACATVVAAVRRGLTERAVLVSLDGGDLHIEWRESDNHVLMTGPVATSFTGTLNLGEFSL